MTRTTAWLAPVAALSLALGWAAPAHADSTCSATYTIYSRPSDGDVIVTIKNQKAVRSTGWTLTAEFPDTYTTTMVWGGTLTSPDPIGTVSLKNYAWNGAVNPGGTVGAGFRVSGSNWPAPLSLTCTMT